MMMKMMMMMTIYMRLIRNIKTFSSICSIAISYLLMCTTPHFLNSFADDPKKEQMVDGWVVSSESCSFNSIGAKYFREVLPGESRASMVI